MVQFSLKVVVTLALTAFVCANPEKSGAQSKAGTQAKASTQAANAKAWAAPPSKDPFYNIPGNIANYANGQIIQHRYTPTPIGNYGRYLTNLAYSHQIQYRTNDNRNRPTATVATVLIPRNANFNKVVSFQIAENEASIDCAPSWGFQLQATLDPFLSSRTTQIQLLLAEAALSKGWIIVAPDYWGPTGAYLANKMGAHAILDGIRASLASTPFTGINPKARVATWGYSIAAPPTQWAVELQPKYAPELKISGAAIGGGSSTLVGSIAGANGGRVAGFIPTVLIGLGSQYPQLAQLVDKHLLPEYKDAFYRAGKQCLDANLEMFGQADVTALFDDWDAVAEDPILTAILLDNNYDSRRSVPTIPLYWYQCAGDTVAPIKQIDEMIDKYCGSKKVSIEYSRNIAPGPNHTTCGVLSAPDAIAWLQTIMDGKDPQPGCSRKQVYINNLTRSFISVFPRYIGDALVQAIGGDLSTIVSRWL